MLKFRVGDRVRINANYNRHYALGKTGTVKSLFHHGVNSHENDKAPFPYFVKLDDASGEALMAENELDLIAED